jgi:hypothetical protein
LLALGVGLYQLDDQIVHRMFELGGDSESTFRQGNDQVLDLGNAGIAIRLEAIAATWLAVRQDKRKAREFKCGICGRGQGRLAGGLLDAQTKFRDQPETGVNREPVRLGVGQIGLLLPRASARIELK